MYLVKLQHFISNLSILSSKFVQ